MPLEPNDGLALWQLGVMYSLGCLTGSFIFYVWCRYKDTYVGKGKRTITTYKHTTTTSDTHRINNRRDTHDS